MTHHNIPTTTVDDIKTHMQSACLNASPPHTTDPEPYIVDINYETMTKDLTFAHNNADVGSRSLSMMRFPWPIRWLARLTGRMVLILSSVFTFQQSQFNRSIVLVIKQLTRITKDTKNTINHHKKKSLAQESSLAAQKEQLTALEAKVNNQTKKTHILEEQVTHWKKRLSTCENMLKDQEKAFQDQRAIIDKQQAQLSQYEKTIISHSQELTKNTHEQLQNKEDLTRNSEIISTLAQDVADFRTALAMRYPQQTQIPCKKKTNSPTDPQQITETKTNFQGKDILQTSNLSPKILKTSDALQIPGYHNQLDLFYATFTNRFRGTRELIKKRSMVYIPIIEKAVTENRKGDILDIGCGRGEWLELMQENKLNALGIDLNEIMIKRCLDNGLSVKKQDVLSCLRGIEDESLRVITGFHIIEHLPFDVLLELLAQCRRVLKTGGVLIFETPNPGNLLVGSHNFYFDPSHRNPLPPELINFLVEIHGFKNIEVRYLNPPEAMKDTEASHPFEKFYDLHFNSPMDYAVIGWKE